MTRYMYDSIEASSIPKDATMMAGYINGHWPSYNPMRILHPTARVLSISVDPGQLADALDVENGDATPAQSVTWARAKRNRGDTPIIYCSASAWPTVIKAHQGQIQPLWWIAHYDGDPAIPVGAIGKQYQSTGPWDLSAMLDYIPGIDPIPAPPVEDDMPGSFLPVIENDTTAPGDARLRWADGTIESVTDYATIVGYRGAGAVTVGIGHDDYVRTQPAPPA